jgi:hypothetical protein
VTAKKKNLQRKPRAKRPVPGAHWRVLAESTTGETSADVRDAGVFDELVVDAWLHIEQMSARSYWMQLGPLRIWITLKPDGSLDMSLERDYPQKGSVTVRGDIAKPQPEDAKAPWWPRKPKPTKAAKGTGVVR